MKYVDTILGIISESKKARALVVGLIALAVIPLASRVGIEVDKTAIEHGIMLLVAYIVGQGIADNGKEAAKVATENFTFEIEEDDEG